ncbi:hypothetical protein AWB78_02431 [Caballeronia calidae]|uniref:Uncharacterized protein n=1 Tax=Caballeronia calidae TaxID=1777139 RepID=A0A158BBD6_9BURK|nr:hypothetical protein AWB78_02431 [Caballeronia calidae]
MRRQKSTKGVGDAPPNRSPQNWTLPLTLCNGPLNDRDEMAERGNPENADAVFAVLEMLGGSWQKNATTRSF